MHRAFKPFFQTAPLAQRQPRLSQYIKAVKKHSLEETVQVVWQGILSKWFPFRQGYKWGIKGSTLSNNNMPDATVIQVCALRPNPSDSEDWAERQILLIECKRPSKDTPLGWDDTITGQFTDDLSATLNASGRLFGAVAIGTKVRFYQWDGQVLPDGELCQLHPGTFDLATNDGIQEVENMMNFIKARGWEWAAPK
ncbi:hypothetical protein BO71DRAFT_450028 [Aspergillus ellipticus CBS 707.79]|uniref:Uncharacterized protein n=1 Tax=Aspergillus ellipticus CBS 707.79 TaxID=1448320 RepID=A0A319DKC1_9EURO|nr:hypothetical protein BO71DRAFT_450028 [Aspergillus ellipticus CBS 707.79]